MTLPKWLTTVTPFSKYLALSLFIILPIGSFILGVTYSYNSKLSGSVPFNVQEKAIDIKTNGADVILGEYINQKSMVMSKAPGLSDYGKLKLRHTDNIINFYVTVPSIGYCVASLPCSYKYGDKYVAIGFSKFTDISKQPIQTIIKAIYPISKTKAISFGKYSGIEPLGLASGQAQSGRSIWFIDKDNTKRNVVYEVSILDWGKGITDKEYMDILSSISVGIN